MRTERQYRNRLKTERDYMHLMKVILKIKHARRDKDYFSNFINGTGLFTARIRYKFITVDTLYIIL
jgi:hypothetical protein